MSAAEASPERSLGQLFSDLMGETRTLLRQELTLAKTELSEKAAFAGRNAAFLAAGGLIVLMGAMPVLAGIVISVGHKIGYATASFIVGILFIVIGAVVIMKSLNAMKRHPLAPREMVEQLKETKQWVSQQTR